MEFTTIEFDLTSYFFNRHSDQRVILNAVKDLQLEVPLYRSFQLSERQKEDCFMLCNDETQQTC
jgi:hypothetical protein